MPYVNGILGNLVSDPEIKVTPSGTQVVNFVVANNSGFGENKHTDFINCTAFNKTAELVQKFFRKGSPILIEGEFKNRPYKKATAKNGREYDVPNWGYAVRSIVFLPKNEGKSIDVLQDESGTNISNGPNNQTESLTDDFMLIDDPNVDMPF